MSAGIVSLQRQPPDPFQWLRYHVAVGITSYYLWLEETDELKPQLEAYAAQLSEETGVPIRMHVVIADKVNRATEDNYKDLQTRQATFVNKMIAQARADGVEWLFHTDADELLHARAEGGDWSAVRGLQPRASHRLVDYGSRHSLHACRVRRIDVRIHERKIRHADDGGAVCARSAPLYGWQGV